VGGARGPDARIGAWHDGLHLLLFGEIQRAVARVIKSGRFILGDEVAQFEDEFARYLSVDRVIGVGSGTDALRVALEAAGVVSGDRVVTTANTSVAVAAAICSLGAEPYWVDIDPYTLNMSPFGPCGLSEALALNVNAVVVTHMYGQPARMYAIKQMADLHGVPIIEDCSHAHGARYAGKAVGTLGDVGVFSFYPTKNLGAFGDGGAVVTNSASIAQRVRAWRQYGWGKRRYISETKGWNSRLDEMQAAILRAKLRHLDFANDSRVRMAQRYDELLPESFLRPLQPTGQHVFHQYVVQHPDRDRFYDDLSKRVAVNIHYPEPLHTQPAYLEYYRSLPHTERAAKRIMSLPMMAWGQNMVEDVVECIKEILL
jgi:dTDP-4-amino-4,6-dideoxygalactose transaminase